MVENYLADLQSTDAKIRFTAAQHLGTINEPRAIAALAQALRDESAKVQYAALSGLVKTAAADRLNDIVTMLLHDLNSRVWELLQLNIGMRLRTGIIDMVQLDDLGLSDRLYSAITTLPMSAHQTALFARMIGKTTDVRRINTCLDLLATGALPVRVAAVEALGMIGDARAVPALFTALEDADDSIRETAAEALGRIGDQSALDVLIRSLHDYSEWVRRASAEALGLLGDDRAIEPLSDALTDEDAMVQDTAFEALKKLSRDQLL